MHCCELLSTNSTLLWICFIKTAGSREGNYHFWYKRERNFCADLIFSTKFQWHFHVKRENITWSNQSEIIISKLEVYFHINKQENILQNRSFGGIRTLVCVCLFVCFLWSLKYLCNFFCNKKLLNMMSGAYIALFI